MNEKNKQPAIALTFTFTISVLVSCKIPFNKKQSQCLCMFYSKWQRAKFPALA